MYYFQFTIDNEVIFRTPIKSLQCEDQTKKGTRCKRRCVIGSSFCSTHLMYNHHLQIKKSTIPNAGLGLFARDALSSDPNQIIFHPGDKIVQYMGEIIDTEELINRYHNKTGPYVVGISKDRFEDGSSIRGVGSLANTLPNHNNTTLSIYRGRASLKATKVIKNGEEILLSYGKQYKLHQPGVDSSTTKR